MNKYYKYDAGHCEKQDLSWKKTTHDLLFCPKLAFSYHMIENLMRLWPFQRKHKFCMALKWCWFCWIFALDFYQGVISFVQPVGLVDVGLPCHLISLFCFGLTSDKIVKLFSCLEVKFSCNFSKYGVKTLWTPLPNLCMFLRKCNRNWHNFLWQK